jgi:glycine oxidase
VKQIVMSSGEKISPVSGIDFEIHETGMLIFDEADFDIGLNYKDQHQEPMQHCELLQREQLEQVNSRISTRFQQAIHFPQV